METGTEGKEVMSNRDKIIEVLIDWGAHPERDCADTADAILAKLADGAEPAALTWYEGAPPFPQDQEWFIAETIYGDRVVLISLDDGRMHKGNYAFKTADGTYMKEEIVKRWMQFPDCEYIPPPDAQAQIDEQRRTIAALMAGSAEDTTTPVIVRIGRLEAERDALQAELAKRDARIEALEKNAARFRFAFVESPEWTYAVCKWRDDDWLPINTDQDIRDLDAAIAQEQS